METEEDVITKSKKFKNPEQWNDNPAANLIFSTILSVDNDDEKQVVNDEIYVPAINQENRQEISNFLTETNSAIASITDILRLKRRLAINAMTPLKFQEASLRNLTTAVRELTKVISFVEDKGRELKRKSPFDNNANVALSEDEKRRIQTAIEGNIIR